ncbi:hypothetical protein GCM10009718_02020 [Isoptericola halotolerans]|uniref:DUF4328 domain-containing protein n=1 Tax=Isoptericola halotolerans TaxID=300560 RepID=A0ABX2A5K0_9MICO|nr:DUF4328 domain-containing protein [Isoptericola halotolerans]NOV96871.1 hypothetical protein [Isoptericola halotolerans]
MTVPDPFAPPSGALGGRPGPVGATWDPAADVHAVRRPGAEPWAVDQAAPQPPVTLAAWTVGLASVWAALQVVLFALAPAAADEYARAIAVGTSPLYVDTWYDTVGAFLLPVQVAVFVVGCLWLQRSREIAVRRSPHVRQVRGAVWVWLGWVVPIVLLWFPFQVVRDVRAGTVGSTRGAGLGLWWTCWLVYLVAANQTGLVSLSVGSRGPESLPWWEGVATLACVVGLVVWARTVRAITASQVSGQIR